MLAQNSVFSLSAISHTYKSYIGLMLAFDFLTRNLDMKEYLVDDPQVVEKHPHTSYDLVANISHDGEPGRNYSLIFHFLKT